MKTLSSLAWTALTATTLTWGLATTAMAQGAPPPKPGTPATPAKPATPATPATPAKPATPPAVTPAPPPPAPKPAPEIASMAKSMAGTWRCTGTAMGSDGQTGPMTATMRSKADLDGFWIRDVFEGKMGKVKYKFEAFSTYDTATKRWRKLMISNEGGSSTGWSDGMQGTKMDWTMDSVGPMGSMPFRDHIEMVDPKNVKAWGEISMDKGRTWVKVYEMACKK
jgi:hypothetical protein